jgi:hypothetical protein
VADERVGRLRTASGRWADDDGFAALLDELRAAPGFAPRWARFATTDRRRGTIRLAHPDLHQLRFDVEALLLPDEADAQRLVTWLPADDATVTALAGLDNITVPSSPAQLRVMG